MEGLKRIYFIRHGESINNVLEKDQSTYFHTRIKDPELSETGKKQCEELKNHLKQVPIQKVITSPMLRCLQTSQILFSDRSIEIEVRPEFYEQGGMWNLHEVFPGMTRSEIFQLFPSFDSKRIPESGYFFLDHMETREECRVRVRELLEILKTYEESTLAVVIHGLLMEHIAEAVCDLSSSLYLKIPQKNCGVTLIERESSSFQLIYQFKSENIT